MGRATQTIKSQGGGGLSHETQDHRFFIFTTATTAFVQPKNKRKMKGKPNKKATSSTYSPTDPPPPQRTSSCY